jgi:hypothetical protein
LLKYFSVQLFKTNYFNISKLKLNYFENFKFTKFLLNF